MLITLLSFTFFSCEQEEQVVEKEYLFPEVTSLEATKLDQYPEFDQFLSGRRITAVYDLSNATTVTYDGVDDMEFIFAPHFANSDIYTVFAVKNSQVEVLPLTFENKENELIVSGEQGTTIYSFNENELTNVNFTSQGTYGRSENCFTDGFVNCTNAIQDEVRELVGSAGLIVFDVACGAWIWCRAAFVTACSAAGAAECGIFI